MQENDMLPVRVYLIEEANDDEMTVNTNKQFNPIIFPVFDKTRMKCRINYERFYQQRPKAVTLYFIEHKQIIAFLIVQN